MNEEENDSRRPGMSDSMIPQLGDSLFERNAINPAPEVELEDEARRSDDDDSGENGSRVETGDSKNQSTENDEDGSTQNSDGAFDEGDNAVSKPLSDSMVPMVGDSILDRSEEAAASEDA